MFNSKTGGDNNSRNIRTYQVRKLLKFSNGALVPQTTSQNDIVNQVATEYAATAREQKQKSPSNKGI